MLNSKELTSFKKKKEKPEISDFSLKLI